MTRKKHINYLLLWFAPCAALFLLTVAVCVVQDIPFAKVLRDPMQIVKAHPLTGFLSNIGVLLWCTAAVCCWFSWFVVRSRRDAGTRQHLLLWGGVLSTVLMLDDFFLLHEKIFPNLLGIPEIVVFGSYALGILAFLWRFRSEAFSTPGRTMEIALVMLSASVVVDLIPAAVWKAPHLLEDGAKFFGIVAWAAFFAGYAFRTVTEPARR